MTKENDEQLNVDELIATLRNSSLPTLIVEGRSDMTVFQSFEEECLSGKIDIFPAGSRTNLLAIYSRRDEYPKANVAFLADSDLCAYHAVPSQYAGIIFTEGYSLENDILVGGKGLKVVSRKNRDHWAKVLAAMSHWFASVVHRCLAGESVGYKLHPNQVVDFQTGEVRPIFSGDLIEGESLCNEAARILQSPIRYLRGHTLIDGLGHFLAEVKQRPKCSKEFLLHLDLVSWEDNTALSRLVSEIRSSITVS
jgi:hypothetical protein